MSWCRRPKTTQEKRAANGSPLHVRAKRYRLLPTNWDDIYVAARMDRCWKRFRSQQYKVSRS